MNCTAAALTKGKETERKNQQTSMQANTHTHTERERERHPHAHTQTHGFQWCVIGLLLESRLRQAEKERAIERGMRAAFFKRLSPTSLLFVMLAAVLSSPPLSHDGHLREGELGSFQQRHPNDACLCVLVQHCAQHELTAGREHDVP